MDRKIKVGILGCGTVAELYYLKGVSEYADRAELTAVCDLVPGRAAAAARKHGVKRVFEDYDAMLDEADLDAVLVLSQADFHYEHAMKALKSGKHVAIEKPMANSFAEAKEIVETAEQRGLKLSCAPSMVLEPIIRRVHELIKGGAIGKVAYVVSRASGSGPARRAGRDFTDQIWFYQAGGGPLGSLGTYNLTALTWILGPVKRVAALSGISIPERLAMTGPSKGQRFKTTAPDNNLLLLDWGDNTFGMSDIGYCAAASKGPGTHYYGERGALVVNGGPGADCIEVFQQDDGLGFGGWVPAGRPNMSAGYNISVVITHLIDCILDGADPLTSGRHALHVTEIMDLAEKSATNGRFMELTTTL